MSDRRRSDCGIGGAHQANGATHPFSLVDFTTGRRLEVAPAGRWLVLSWRWDLFMSQTNGKSIPFEGLRTSLNWLPEAGSTLQSDFGTDSDKRHPSET